MYITTLNVHDAGVQTGTLYSGDPDDNEMAGERVCPTTDMVYVVATHEIGDAVGKVDPKKCNNESMNLDFKKAVFLLRNPFNAFVEEYTRLRVGKINTATKDLFSNASGKHYVVHVSLNTQVFSSFIFTYQYTGKNVLLLYSKNCIQICIESLFIHVH